MLWYILPMIFLTYMLLLSPAILIVDILIICRIAKGVVWKKYKIVSAVALLIEQGYRYLCWYVQIEIYCHKQSGLIIKLL